VVFALFGSRLQLKCDGTWWRNAWEGKWRGNWRMECVASTLYTTSEHGVSSITTADAHTSAASSRLNWRPRRFKWTRPLHRKTKSGFCACAITLQLAPSMFFIHYCNQVGGIAELCFGRQVRGYYDWDFLGFSQFLQLEAMMIFQIIILLFLFIAFSIHYALIILSFDTV